MKRAVFVRSALLLCCGVSLGLPRVAGAWSGQQHVQINRAAGRNMPSEAAAFRAFSRPMAFPGIYPDLWKGNDPDEGQRHYFEPDRLPATTDIRAFSPSQVAAFLEIKSTPEEIGIAPWIILELLEKMTDAMRTNNWVWAAQCGAAMGHYAADIHMPLHCTRNFNGQETWQMGVHTRIEGDMTKAFFKDSQIRPGPVVHLQDPFRDIMTWIEQSASLAPVFLRADLIAKQAANGRTDSETYFAQLWELTGDHITDQISDATTHLASLWYTAWLNAGRPLIPPPSRNSPCSPYTRASALIPPARAVPLAPLARKKIVATISFCGASWGASASSSSSPPYGAGPKSAKRNLNSQKPSTHFQYSNKTQAAKTNEQNEIQQPPKPRISRITRKMAMVAFPICVHLCSSVAKMAARLFRFCFPWVLAIDSQNAPFAPIRGRAP